MRLVDLTGQKFNRLSVVSISRGSGKKILWNCLCDCGKELRVLGDHLKSGHTKSCGCYRHDMSTKADARCRNMTPEYAAWVGIKQRCSNKKLKDYRRYAGRGIQVCDRWKKSFDDFLQDMGNRPGPNYSIERKDNDGDYTPENCIWTTAKVQARNRSTSRIVEYRNERRTLVEWCELLKINYSSMSSRLNIRKWSVEEAFETPVRPMRKAA